jgi:hypothetical protein
VASSGGADVTYHVYFYDVANVQRAERLLKAAGFNVCRADEQAPPDAPHGLTASIAAESEDDASAKLYGALSDIAHDPLISYQVTRLSEFLPPTG